MKKTTISGLFSFLLCIASKKIKSSKYCGISTIKSTVAATQLTTVTQTQLSLIAAITK